MFRHALVLLRRELRLDDNTALLAACASAQQVSIGFIIDPRQVTAHRWRSAPGLAFMQASLHALHDDLVRFGSGLHVAENEAAAGLDELIAGLGCDAVFANRDYTPFARRRDDELVTVCKRRGVELHLHDDVLLHAPGSVLTGSGTAFQVFTPFHRASVQRPVPTPRAFDASRRLRRMPANEQQLNAAKIESLQAGTSPVENGREGAMAIVQHLPAMQAYAEQRDLPRLDATSHLSVHLKFGTLSAREAWHATCTLLGEDHPLLRQLHWRDFFTHVGWHYPHVFGHAFNRRFESIRWADDEVRFTAWCEGRTGFPMVDAGMRELAETGFMHNRARMIAASFLVKDLHIDWRHGEAWFARHLVDYDPAVNNGNWQWAASTGCDAQPWFRIFNPWLQQKRFDPDAVYVRRWIPALASCSSGRIADWARHGDARLHPLPIVEHREQAAAAKAMFAEAAHQDDQSHANS